MKKVLLIAALTAVSFAGFAQDEKSSGKKLGFSAGVEAALPFGDFGDGYSFGIGATVQADYKVADQVALFKHYCNRFLHGVRANRKQVFLGLELGKRKLMHKVRLAVVECIFQGVFLLHLRDEFMELYRQALFLGKHL